MSNTTYNEFKEILNQLTAFISDTGADLDASYDWVADQIGYPAVSYTHLTLPTNREV